MSEIMFTNLYIFYSVKRIYKLRELFQRKGLEIHFVYEHARAVKLYIQYLAVYKEKSGIAKRKNTRKLFRVQRKCID